MSIELVRIDDRLIHGQVIIAWSKVAAVQRMVVIDDKVAADMIRKMLLQTIAPPGVSVSILTVAQAIEMLSNDSFANEKLFLLFSNPTDMLALVIGGIIIHKVNIGGMSFGQGKMQLTKAVSIDEQDKSAFKKLHQHGVILEIQMLPNDNPIDVMSKI